MNWKMLFNISLNIFCLIGLIVQTTYLLEQYMSGTTVVNIRFKRLQNEKIPSITVCYPCYMSLLNAAQLKPTEYQTVFNEYKNLLDSISLDKENETINKKLFDLYYGVYESFGRIRADTMPIIDLFERLSIPFNRTINGETHLSINVHAHGIFNHENGSIDYIHVKDDNPIENFAAEYGSQFIRKCYTFFSALNKKWRDFHLDLDFMTIDVKHNNQWFAPKVYELDYNSAFISLHSPNILPNLLNNENFFQIQTQIRYQLTYSQVTTDLLDNRFDTKCREYDLNDNLTHINMWSDCVPLCLVDAMKKECRIGCVFQTEALLRKNLFINSPNVRYCHQNFDNNTINECLDRNIMLKKYLCSCHSACLFDYYESDLKVIRPLSFSRWQKEIVFVVKHSGLPQ